MRAARRIAELSTSNPKVKASGVAALLALAVFVVAGCGGDEQAQGGATEEQATDEPKTEQKSDAGARTEDSGKESEGGEGSDEDSDRESDGEVTLSLEGDAGTGFSGVCTVGEEEENLEGEVPESFAYDLDGGELECEIRKQDTGSGSLRVILLSGDDRSVQQTNTPGGVVNLVYSGNDLSSSTSSGSVNQSSSSSSSGSSSMSSSFSSSSVSSR